MGKLSRFLVLSLFVTTACGTNPNNLTKTDTAQVVVTADKTEKVTFARVSEKPGATFSLKINRAVNGSFKTQANVDGKVAKTDTDIDHFIVYLVKNSNIISYPPGGDPLGTTDMVAGPFTIANTAPTNSQLVTFTNVPSAGAEAYYVAVRAQDVANNDLIKDNNAGTPWTGITSSTPGVAVSTGSGIVVSGTFTVSSTTALVVTPQLKDAVGAAIEADVNPNNGSSTLPAITAN